MLPHMPRIRAKVASSLLHRRSNFPNTAAYIRAEQLLAVIPARASPCFSRVDAGFRLDQLSRMCHADAFATSTSDVRGPRACGTTSYDRLHHRILPGASSACKTLSLQPGSAQAAQALLYQTLLLCFVSW